MKFVAFFVLAAAFFAAPCCSKPFIMELPGYAKAVMGGYGKFRAVSRNVITMEITFKTFDNLTGNISTSWYAETRRPFYSFRYFHYAAKPTYETRFLVPRI